ncbi:sigma 54-interacting transcriptional regulator [Polyangium jinanense]|uniref:Sigma 54-interacting transcriptional regulator n=1 Tax=Polyangium jinanense TaxID=2829994 RepID=A0A9X4AQ94_9BACT|nr:sigma 54-interacting transcriptional regulator [Polyangium jinanense]MDC3954013.1 sigma 54-interacting transcriptional regulator [Polyangium jinanense]MDC3957774.1 sigma 54-interacting transcriptional regulator [Polyangium jinanense]MDC3978860.1 sigma 54-interacting transcriptional regulator [Polyangium jinanense]MDC3982031.1 sigma 54-interacting transcriptional regulator [Polyangium jinanense]
MGRRDRDALLVHARYAAGEPLGRGAQGIVLRVVDREDPGRSLTAKVFRPGAFEPSALLGEFALLSRLRLPGVVRAHDLGHDERTGAPFLVEDFVPGLDAATWVRGATGDADRNRRLADLCAGVAASLAALHDAGFLHGDLKPAHVRMRPDTDRERPVLLDLGAAVFFRARALGQSIAASPGYAAPEVLAGAAPTIRSDLYGLGALAWAAATGAPPPLGNTKKRLSASCPWLRPTLAEIVEALVEVHPLDRPEDTRRVLSFLGASATRAGERLGAPPTPVGREAEIAALSAPSVSPVRYVVGPSGAGKSHLARELLTRTLCAGRAARLVSLPAEAGSIVPRLIGFFRGMEPAPPLAPAAEGGTALLLIDGLEAGPPELAAALDAYRCRNARAPGLDVVVTARAAPAGADVLGIEPLAGEAFVALCHSLGLSDAAAIERARAASEGLPGWLLASLGRVPLERDTALGRASGLPLGARGVLAAIALSGGAMPEGVCHVITRRLGGEGASLLAELLSASLIGRRVSGDVRYVLSSPELGPDLAAALATPELVDLVAEVWLSEPNADAAALLSVAKAAALSTRRDELLARAARAARESGLLSLEIEALLLLLQNPAQRTRDLLCRLERLVRDAGLPGAHPEVLRWLDEAASQDASLRPLSLRRRAEQKARAGATPEARALAEEALAAARRTHDRQAEAFAHGTLGLVALFSADYTDAAEHLARVQAILGERGSDDPEELARIHHNAGVVALYRNRAEQAIETFSRALGEKRGLGDRAGMRSCLMNLGMALGRAGRHAEAEAALAEATLLSRSLGQEAGLGWCLFTRAELEVRRGHFAAAAPFVVEAWALGESLPAVVRADLLILRARIRARAGDGAGALAALGELSAEARARDALVDVRARLAEVEARLATLPTEPRRAGRIAIGALRRAREARLVEGEAEAREALSRALAARRPVRYAPRMAAEDAGEEALWEFLAGAARASPEELGLDLARRIASRAGAERAFVVLACGAVRIGSVYGADLDGLALTEAGKRLDAGLLREALGSAEPLYQRDIPTAGGRGARLVVAGPEGPQGSAIVVVEHRFRPGAFDRVTAAEARRWGILAALVFRLSAAAEPEEETLAPRPVTRKDPGLAGKPAPDPPGATTLIPVSGPRRSFPGIVGDSPALTRALGRLEAALPSDLPVLVVGETGVGKEIFARALHDLGPRARGPFVAMNCGGIPDTLFEAELFGHARGAFTGAERARTGLLVQANGGTLLLDEIGELSLLRQASLLRALEARRFRPIGSDEERAFDVRIVAATNRDLEKAVADGTFRQDLFYRLNAITIRVPPLRERAEDVPLLCRAFLPGATFAEDALAALSAHPWPGNVRELRNVMERLGVLGASRIERAHLPRAIRGRGAAIPEADERAPIRRALAETGGNISQAASLLGLSRQGLKKRMVRLGMREPTTSRKKLG